MQNSTKEVLIDIVNWYNSVSNASMVTVDNVGDLKPVVERAKAELEIERYNNQFQFHLFDPFENTDE